MAPVVAAQVKEKPFLICPYHLRQPHATKFFNRRPINVYLGYRCRLAAMPSYKSSTNIVRKARKALWRFQVLLKNKISENLITMSLEPKGPINKRETGTFLLYLTWMIWKNIESGSFVIDF